MHQLDEFPCPAVLQIGHWQFSRPSHCIVRLIDSGVHTQQSVRCIYLCNNVSDCLITVKSGFLGLRLNCEVRSWVVTTARSLPCVCVKKFHLHRPCLAQFFISILWIVLLSLATTCRHELSTSAAENGVVGISRITQGRSSEILCPKIPSQEDSSKTRRFTAPCDVSNNNSSVYLVVAHRHFFGASEFQNGVICIMVSEEPHSCKLHQLLVARLTTHMCAYFSPVALNLKIFQYPKSSDISSSPSCDDVLPRQSRMCSSAVLKVVLVLPLNSWACTATSVSVSCLPSTEEMRESLNWTEVPGNVLLQLMETTTPTCKFGLLPFSSNEKTANSTQHDSNQNPSNHLLFLQLYPLCLPLCQC